MEARLSRRWINIFVFHAIKNAPLLITPFDRDQPSFVGDGATNVGVDAFGVDAFDMFDAFEGDRAGVEGTTARELLSQ